MGRMILKLCGLCLVTTVVLITALIAWLLRPLEEQDKTINTLDSRYLIAHAGGGLLKDKLTQIAGRLLWHH